jgi:hypothetical protein
MRAETQTNARYFCMILTRSIEKVRGKKKKKLEQEGRNRESPKQEND